MIKIIENNLLINGTRLSFPIRIKQVIEIENFIIVCIGYDYALDVGAEWNNGGKEKWHKINTAFRNPTLFCFDKLGNLKWEFKQSGFFNISKLDDEPIDNDLRVKHWIQNNPNNPNIFIVYGDDKLLVDYKTGEIYERLEIR
jgi:nuclear transport factor 2 (NTF2) superfamily protein